MDKKKAGAAARATVARAGSDCLAQATRALIPALRRLSFAAPVAFVYNPLDYAREPHEQFLRRYGGGRKKWLLVGMNPGPFGMAQTGVPFGEVAAVRDYLGIEAPVHAPQPQHPRRPILGFDCRRSEVSGRRLWGWCQHRFGPAKAFLKFGFVHNYCPLVFMEQSGRNITPDKLPVSERAPLFEICDELLRAVVDLQRPEWVLGIGGFAEARVRQALIDRGLRFGRLPHPSPASPLANRGWDEAADKALASLGLDLG